MIKKISFEDLIGPMEKLYLFSSTCLRWRERMFTRRLPLLMALGILIMGSMGFLSSIDDDVEAVGSPAISIRFAQQKMTAYVGPGQDGIVTFTGTVTAQAPWSPNVQQLIVQLEPEAGGWACTTPPELPFSKGQTERDFAITVQVPQGTSHMDQGTLLVPATWHYEPGPASGSVEPVTAIIYVAQYYDCDLDTSTPILEAEKGGYAEFVVDVINNGNANDKMILEVLNLDDLVSDDITIQMSDNIVSVPEKQSVELSILAYVDEGTSTGRYKIVVEVRSKQAEDAGKTCDTDAIELYLEVVREIQEPEEPDPEPEEPIEDPEVPEEEPEVPQEEPDNGEDVEEIMEEDPTYTPKEESVPSLGILGLVLSTFLILLIVKRYRDR